MASSLWTTTQADSNGLPTIGRWGECSGSGIESRPIPRRGSYPADGPDQWTAGTLFPRSSKKTARAINAASGNRPLVVLANLSGFDGSPESLRKLQLEYGAEIGRAITNFDGPIVFCVVSRYHGGAFVVFSGVLNENMEVLAVEGSYASVLGGAPAAAVVFTREVDKRTAADPRVRELEAAMNAADGVEQAHLRVELATLRGSVRSESAGRRDGGGGRVRGGRGAWLARNDCGPCRRTGLGTRRALEHDCVTGKGSWLREERFDRDLRNLPGCVEAQLLKDPDELEHYAEAAA